MASWHIAKHLVKRTMGSRRGLFLNAIVPAIILSVIGGLLSSFESDKVNIIVNNEDSGILGEYLVTSLAKEPIYNILSEPLLSEQQLKDRVIDGKAAAAIYIPFDFTASIVDGGQSKANFYRMNIQLWNASLAAALVNEGNKLSSSAALVRTAGDQGTVDLTKLKALLEAQASPKAVHVNKEMKLGDIVSNPTVVGLILMFVMMLVSQSIGFVMEDRDQRTMARMFTAPLRAIDIAFGNFMGSMIVGTLQLVIMLGLTYYVFGYSPGIPFGSMLVVLLFFLLAAVGFASAVAGLVRNSTQLSQMNNLIIIPTCMISGCFFPLSMLPDFMQKLANFTPQKWALLSIDRLGGGGSFSEIGMPLFILILFAAVFIVFGSAVLRPNRTR